ncbi:hypothetical protein SMD44_p10130 (plasmid) [Streptomyces alboflavus]|uniref:Cytochrome P450 n=1 Tax=Streptomyces alboflavus TaxID=67267 RepID=A0A291W4X1_9ACTN|nr:cytochrome P450 [Streptomyces alboflavus]ATM24629.1 hypothetical protein SMD44_p10130 [Streptomyces alboflavus]
MPASHVPSPSCSIDLFADQVLADPYPTYDVLRSLGPATYLAPHGVWAVPGHAEIQAVLKDEDGFRSAGGLALTPFANAELLTGMLLAADGDQHARLRQILTRHLAPRAIYRLQDEISDRADRLVSQHIAGGTFDAVVLARQLVTGNVLKLMGLSADVGSPLTAGGGPALFDGLGPDNSRYQQALPAATEMVAALKKVITRGNVTEGSWMATVFAAVDAGQIDEAQAVPLTATYTAASMDTTILGLAGAIVQLARQPQQWALLRREPIRAESALHEALRLDAPLQGLGRLVHRTTDLDGVRIEAGEQLWLLYGSAGRDERQWGIKADVFDIKRWQADQHLAFGAGPHLCAGKYLALMQARALLRALAARCTRLSLREEPRRLVNNTLRGYASALVTVEPAPRSPTGSARQRTSNR